MPLNAYSFTSEEDIKLIDLVKPHPSLYKSKQDPTRRSIVARGNVWQIIANEMGKSLEECKKRWRTIRDGYMRSKRLGTAHRAKTEVYEKLQFLDTDDDETTYQDEGSMIELEEEEVLEEAVLDDKFFINPYEIATEEMLEQQVIPSNKYYQIKVQHILSDDKSKQIEGKEEELPEITFRHPVNINDSQLKILNTSNTDQLIFEEPPPKIKRKNCGRKKTQPVIPNMTPIKILPKPAMMRQQILKVKANEEETEQVPVLNALIEKILKEHTNEIDVFFRSMAASVKKLQPNLIPKVKMEVCNVIAKYEMQSFDS